MMTKRTVLALAVISAVLVLQGCATSKPRVCNVEGSNGYEAWCGDTDDLFAVAYMGGKPKSAPSPASRSDVAQAAPQETPEDPIFAELDEPAPALGDTEEAEEESTPEPVVLDVKPRASALFSPPAPGQPVYRPSSVHRLWIAPWRDPDTRTLHAGETIYYLDEDQFTFGSVPPDKRIQIFRPAREGSVSNPASQATANQPRVVNGVVVPPPGARLSRDK